MKAIFFEYKKQVREYYVFGKGPKLLYAFHGFGQNGSIWRVFREWLADEFTIYAFNDFYHSETNLSGNINNDLALEKEEIVDFFKHFAHKNGHRSVNLMAYSSGARTVLTLIEHNAFKINEVWLFAPDGIKLSFWNSMFCRYTIVQALFRRINDDPKWFFRTVSLLKYTGLLNKRRLSFVLYSMRVQSKRTKVYNYWLKYRNVIPLIDKVIENGNENDVRIHLVFGKNDVLINEKIGKRFLKDYGRNADLFVIDASHHLIVEKHVSLLIDRYPLK